MTLPGSLLKKGTGSEPTTENPAESGLQRRACPLFQQAARYSLAAFVSWCFSSSFPRLPPTPSFRILSP